MRDIAAVTNIEVSTLSRIENGKRKVDLDTLVPIARALRTSIDDLFGLPPVGVEPSLRLTPTGTEHDGILWIPLGRNQRDFNIFEVRIPENSWPAPEHLLDYVEHPLERPVRHSGREWIRILSGDFYLDVAGYPRERLTCFNTVEFDGSAFHGFSPVAGGHGSFLIALAHGSEHVHWGTAREVDEFLDAPGPQHPLD